MDPVTRSWNPRRAALLLLLLVALQAVGWGQSEVPNVSFSRPVPEGGGATIVYCAMAVLDVDEITDAKQNFTVNLFTRFQWNDPRQAHGGEGKIVKPIGEIWHPNIVFLNRQRIWPSLGGDVEISPNGDVVYRQQFWGDFSQPMNLHDFPFDSQTFEIQAVAAGPEEVEDLEFRPDPEIESFIVDRYSVADWKVSGMAVSVEPFVAPSGGRTNSFTFSFTAERLSNYILIKVIAPLLMIIILSMVVFWLDPKEGGSQLGVAVTSFLTMIAYHIALSSRMPEISYLTRFDVFVFGTTLLVFLAMIEVVITTGLAKSDRLALAWRLDRVCRMVFPGLLVLIALYAFVWH